MQTVKYLMRQVGIPNPETGVISVEDFEAYLKFQFLDDGFEVHTATMQPLMHEGRTVGDRVSMVLVKNEPTAKAK